MEKEKLESMIIDYIDNRLNTVDRLKIEQVLVSNADAYKLYEELKEVIDVMDKSSRLEPSQNLRTRFDAMLYEEVKSNKQGRTILFSPTFYRVAAAVTLLVLGAGVGYWISKQNDQHERLMAIEQEMAKTKLMMMNMLDNDESASQRIQGVNVAYKIDRADQEIVKALVKTMNEDPNTNVRLAAMEALSKFSSEATVKQALIQSLSRQTDPVVQIALIQLMVKMKETGVVEDLRKIVEDAETIQVVKDEAYSGILRLS